MTRLDAHARFALMADKSFLPGLESDPHFPAVAVALAECAGWLDDAETDGDLRAAAEQGESLFATGVIEGDVIADVADDVIRSVMEWAEQQGATCSRDS